MFRNFKMKQKQMNYHEKYAEFYNSAEWKNLRNQKFFDADGLCELCRKNGIIKESKEIHHIIPIEEDWSKRLDYDNLIALCSDCHNAIHNRQSSLQQFLNFWDSV